MSETKFSIHYRFKEFWSNLSTANFRSRQSLTIWLGWFISLLLFSITITIPNTQSWQIFLFLHIIFLFIISAEIYKKIQPPVELLLILFQFLFQIASFLIKFSIKQNLQIIEPGALLTVLHAFILGFLILIFSLIFVYNNKGKRHDIVGFTILGFFAHFVFTTDNVYWLFFFQAILFISLLSKTRWLEELTRIECWIYLVLIVFFYRIGVISNPYRDYVSTNFAHPLLWHTVPYYLYLLFKLYLLALIVKIPVVLIYNHASLSRKLKISGLFQSTFPQLIQLIILLLIFYFFIAGWQARNLQRIMIAQLEKIHEKPDPSLHLFKSRSLKKVNSIKLEDYEALPSIHQLPDKGALELQKKNLSSSMETDEVDYFLFSKESVVDTNFIFLVRIDTTFLKQIADQLNLIAGTSMIVHPLKPEKWLAYLYKMKLLYQGDRYIKIFPFTILPYPKEHKLSIPLESAEMSISRFRFGFIPLSFGEYQLTFGRVFIPLWEADATENRYLAFDIVLNLGPQVIRGELAQIFLIMFLIYVILNSLVVRRVVKFGSQINESIVQKFNQLKRGIQQISRGNLDYKIKLEGEDEFVELANRFNEMSDRLQQSIAEARQKDLLEYELQLAREVQLSLLPQRLPEIAGFQIAASMRTANTVGGDFYDIFYLDENRLLFTIGDVSGKGSSAALYMAQCMSLVRFSRQFTSDTIEICTRLNDYFTTTITDRQIFVTVIVGLLDIQSNEIHLVRAGHTEPIYIPGKTEKAVKFLTTKGIGIGLTKESRLFKRSLKSYKISFEPGDTLLLYTDGVIEAAKEFSETEMAMYGEERLHRLLSEMRGKSAAAILHGVEMDIETFYAESPRVDDHTMLVIQRKKDDK